MKKIRTLVVQNKRVEVSEDIYIAYYQEREHEKYLLKKARDNEYSYEGMKESGINFEYSEGFASESPEEKLIKDMERENLRNAIKRLSNDEMIIIDLYYFKNKTEQDISKIFNVSQKAINKRKRRILEKIRSFL